MKEAMDNTSSRAQRKGHNSIWVSLVLQHFERYHASVLANLLDKSTQLQVQQAPDRSRAHANPDLPVIKQLENELRSIRAELQSAMQHMEIANEELKSSNEELLSKNDELHNKILALDVSNSEFQHHLDSTQIATIVVDRDLRILRCTPGASKLFNMLESDIGRPFRDVAPRFVEADLLGDMMRVLWTEMGMERIVHCADRVDWFLLRIVPYWSQDEAVTGVGVTFVNVSNLRKALQQAAKALA
jgi:two-component system CheB/CheR fusion protein